MTQDLDFELPNYSSDAAMASDHTAGAKIFPIRATRPSETKTPYGPSGRGLRRILDPVVIGSPTPPNSKHGQEDKQAWLKAYHLEFNPFSEVNGEKDANIANYLVEVADLDHLTAPGPFFVFGDFGCGKSSFRARLAAACREGDLKKHTFAISYVAPEPTDQPQVATEQHFSELCTAAAKEIWLLLLTRPIDALEKYFPYFTELAAVLQADLPLNLSNQLRRNAGRSFTHQVSTLDPTAATLFNPPDWVDQQPLFDALSQALTGLPPDSAPASAEIRFGRLMDLVRRVFVAEQFFILIDGIDGWFDSRKDLAPVMEIMQFFFERLEAWQQEGIYLKFFLPEHLYEPLKNAYSYWLTTTKFVAKIEWREESLTSLIQKRLQFASESQLDSFSDEIIAEPRLSGVDERLAELAHGNPRRAVWLANELLRRLLKRTQNTNSADEIPRLKHSDLQAVEEAAQHSGPPGP